MAFLRIFGAMGLHFRVLSIPVQVHVTHLVLLLVISGPLRLAYPSVVVPFMLLVMGSVLLHELGHALVLRAQGVQPRITLHGLGGVTTRPIGCGHHEHSGRTLRQDAVMTAAGPLTNVALAALFWAAAQVLEPGAGRLEVTLLLGVVLNLVLAVANLVPIWPLDGGRLLEAALRAAGVASATRWTHAVSLLAAIPAIAFLAGHTDILGVALVSAIAILNVHQATVGHRDEQRRRELEAAALGYVEGAPDAVGRLRVVLASTTEPKPIRDTAALLLLHHCLSSGRRSEADLVLATAPSGAALREALDPLLEGAWPVPAADAARALLEIHQSPLLAYLVMRDLAEDGEVEALLRFSESRREIHGLAGRHATLTALFRAGHFDAAAEYGLQAWGEGRDPLLAYNLACTEARRGHVGAGLAWLDEAVAAGFDDPGLLDADDDLAPLRDHPDYQAIRRRITAPAGTPPRGRLLPRAASGPVAPGSVASADN